MSGSSLAASREALHRAVVEHHALVYRLAYRVLGNRADAEDVAQEVFLRLVRTRAAALEVHALRPWLARVTLNTARNHQRSARRRRLREDAWPGPAAPGNPGAEVAMAKETLAAALAELPDGLRLPIVLYYQEGLKYREIAAALGCPEGTIARRIATAKERLRERLGRSAALGGAPAPLADLEGWLREAVDIPVPPELVARLAAAVDHALASGMGVGGTGIGDTGIGDTGLGPGPSLLSRTLVVATLCTVVAGGLAWVWLREDAPANPASRGGREIAASDEGAAAAPETSAGGAEPAASATAPEATASPPPAAEPAAEGALPDHLLPSVVGRVTDSDGHPMPGAQVRLFRKSEGAEADPVVATTETDADGSYAFHARPAPVPVPGSEASASEDPTSEAPPAEASPASENDAERPTGPPGPATARSGRAGNGSIVIGGGSPPTAVFGGDEGVGGLVMLGDEGPLHQVEATAQGHAPGRSSPFILPEQETTTIDLTLTVALPLAGVVIASGYPVAGAVVSIQAHSAAADPSAEHAQVTTDERGRFRFPALGSGSYLLGARAPRHSPGSTVAAAGDEGVRMELESGSTLRVQVHDSLTGTAVADAELRLAAEDRVVAYAIADESGTAELKDLRPGSYVLHGHRGALGLVTRAVTLVPGTEAQLTLPLPAGATVRGTVQSPPGVPSARYQACLALSGALPLGQTRTVTTDCDEAGAFSMSGLPAGDYQVLVYDVSAPWQKRVRSAQPLRIEPGQDSASITCLDDPHLRAACRIVVRAPDGLPIQYAFAQVTFSTHDAHAAMASNQGGTLDLSLPPGRYRFQIGAPGYGSVTLSEQEVATGQPPLEVTLTPRTDLASGPGERSGEGPSGASGARDDLRTVVGEDLQLTVRERLTLRQLLDWLAVLIAPRELRIAPELDAASTLDDAPVAAGTYRVADILPFLLRHHRLRVRATAGTLEVLSAP